VFSRFCRGAGIAGKLQPKLGRGSLLLALSLFACLPACLAGALRVTSWNLECQAGAGTNELRIEEAAAALKKLAPDVILLQQVRDWKMCAQLAEALRPAEYSVQICSSFRDARTGSLNGQQVAILSKGKAYFSWSEGWRPQGEASSSGGFAFAALKVGQQRFGFFSVQAGAPATDGRDAKQREAAKEAQPASVAQLLEQVGSVSNWVSNRVGAFVVGATFDTRSADWKAARDHTLRVLEASDFGDALRETPTGEIVSAAGKAGQPFAGVDLILTQPPGCAANPRTLAIPAAGHYPVTCDVELDPVKIAVARAVRAEAIRVRQMTPPQTAQTATAAPQPSTINYQLSLLAGALGGIIALSLSVLILRRRRQLLEPRPPALLAAGGDVPMSYTVVVGTRSATDGHPPKPSSPQGSEPVIHVDAPEGTHTHAEVLRQRALAAEERADRAQAVIRNGMLPHLRQWLKQKLVRRLITDRSRLLETQQAAAQKVRIVEERLSRLELMLLRQNDTYQARIEALTRELATAKEENRELIRARIAQVKAEMQAARARLVAQSEADRRTSG
jgi:hypothetical protein